MSISISGSNAIAGLSGNDTDFDKVLENLKKIESTQLNRLEAWKSDWNLRYEAFSQIIEQVQAANSMLSQLANKNSFVTKNVTSSDENVITAVANASAQDVQHTIKVSQTASQAIWANTGKVFSSKTDSINTTGKTQEFRFKYAGKDHTFSIPANTTLDSFASMVNNAADNPGIKVSLIQTGSGYVFQIAGKDTGVENDLYIYPSELEGMKLTAGSTSIWQTNNPINPAARITNPSEYVFDIVLQNGARKSFTVKGDITPDEFAATLERQGNITATWDGTDLKIDGLQSIARRGAKDDEYEPASTRVKLEGNGDALIKDSIKSFAAAGGDTLKFTITLDNGETREVKIRADATNADLLQALDQAVGGTPGSSDNPAKLNTDASGKWGIDLAGVKDITVAKDDGSDIGQLDIVQTAAAGTRHALGGSITAAELAVTFKKANLTDRLDGKTGSDPGETLQFTLVDKAGNAHLFEIGGEKTYQNFLDELSAFAAGKGITVSTETDADGNAIVKFADIKSFELTAGSIGRNVGLSYSVKTNMSIPGGGGDDVQTNLFYKAPGGSYSMEKGPALEFIVTTNDGRVGVLTMDSGSSMQQVIYAMRDTSGAKGLGTWVWKDAEGNAASPPASLGITYTDRDGKEYVGADGKPLNLGDIDGEIYLNFTNIQSVSGPEIAGQVASSSNWNIQRSANAVFQVDNWPVEMESATNNITDVIEGVVFDIQDVGEARISVSTDITSVEQSIQNYLDAVNSVLLTVNELMKYDENKEVTSNDPNDIGNDNYSASGLTNQKGGLLTGNYGVQLFKSRFSSLLTTTPPGFKAKSQAADILSGDVLASLSQLGIKTDTDTTSDTYGLLVLAPSSTISQLQTMDQENYEDMITNHLDAVVDFFCASGIGSSTSTDFRYGSHVEGITKAGVYDVQYSVNDAGEITKVTVGGVEAKRDDSQPGNYYSVASGDAKGLAILIDNLEPGDHPPAGETMQVRIKQGLVQTTQNFLKAELVFNDVNISTNSTPEEIADAVYLKSQNGALMSLRDNYMTVMESIDVKIEREQRRIDNWYKHQKQIFANLETLLSQYSEQQKSLESQLKQLSGND